MITLSLADGETRQARTWPDGSYECPFCGSAISSPEGWAEMERANAALYAQQGETYQARPYSEFERANWQARRCGNPACMTGLDAAGLTALREQIAERQRQARERAAADRAAAEYAAAWRAAEDQRRSDLTAKATEAGQCLACLRATWHGRARLVRHRDPANCPQARRYSHAEP